jgi:nitrite reductase/ring-hydroxylating ferredoxin subunit
MSSEWPEYVLCRFDELAENASRGFTLEGTPPLGVFIVRLQGRVYAYRNSCPHTGVTLDWLPDQFLNEERSLIQCSTHAALFQIDDGLCIAGPCAGARLSAVPVVVIDGSVRIQNKPQGK